jgi:hypothetical protein
MPDIRQLSGCSGRLGRFESGFFGSISGEAGRDFANVE